MARNRHKQLRPGRGGLRARRVAAGLVLAGAWLFGAATLAVGAPKARLWERWLAHAPASTERVDHGAWDRFLERYLIDDHPSGINRVRYSEVTKADSALLDDYLQRLQAVAVSDLNRDEQMAYWINLYNALTVKLVVDSYPVDSMTRINPSRTLFARGPWDAKLVRVEGEDLTLNDIEHRILRPIWKDPRIHYAVNCASLGCPNLQPVAYTAANTEQLLDRGAREYINHPRGAHLENGRLVLSSIYDWYQEDFGGNEAGVLLHLERYAEPGLAAALRDYEGRISYEYDWGLNEP
jgi:hypothetical protein